MKIKVKDTFSCVFAFKNKTKHAIKSGTFNANAQAQAEVHF